MKDKKLLIVICIIIVIVLGIILIKSKSPKDEEQEETTQVGQNYEVNQDGTKLNNSEKLNETKNLNGLEITNIQLTTSVNGLTVLLADVKNTMQVTTQTKSVSIKLLDENGEVLTTVRGKIKALEPEETTQLNIGVSADYASAYDFEIEEN